MNELAAFGRVVEAHYAAVAAVAFAITRDVALAEDVAQDTFVAAWTNRASLRDPARLRPWLCGIARNQAKNALRERRRDATSDEEAVDVKPSVIDRAVETEAARSIEAALAAIPAAYREPIVLFYWQDQSIEQVAATLEISAPAAQKRISRARGYLKDELEARFEQNGRARKQAAAAVAAAVLATIASRTSAASATKGSTKMLGKLTYLGAAGIAATAGVVYHGARDVAPPLHASEHATSREARSASPPPALEPRLASSVTASAATRSATRALPSAYQLTVISPTDVGVDLAGGQSGVTVPQPDPVPTRTRQVRGHVIDSQGRGIANSVVVVGKSLGVQFGALLGKAGATTGADGSFDITAAADAALVAIALDPRGWSAVTQVPAAGELVLPIGAPGTLAFHVSQQHSERDAAVELTQPAFQWMVETDSHGELSLPGLAPGTYHVRVTPREMFAGGATAPVEKDVIVRASSTTDVAIDLPGGTLLAVTPHHAHELAAIVYFLAKGSVRPDLAELRQLARAGEVMDMLFGGKDLDRPMQFHDLAPGTYTLCIDQRVSRDAHLPLDCRDVDIARDRDVVDLDVDLP